MKNLKIALVSQKFAGSILKCRKKSVEMIEKVAKDTSVPVELLTGEDEETCKKQAEAIMKFAKPKSYPGTKGNRGRVTEHHEKDDAMREFARQIFSKGE